MKNKLVFTVMNLVGAFFLLLVGIKSLWGWDWGQYVVPIISIVVGAGLLTQGSIRRLVDFYKRPSKTKMTIRLAFHTISSIAGGVLILMGTVLLFGGQFPYVAPTLFVTSGWYILEIIEDKI